MTTSRFLRVVLTAGFTALVALVAFAATPQVGTRRAGPLRVEISFPASAHARADHRPRLRDDLADRRARAAPADRPHGRAVLRPRRREAGARPGGRHRRDRPRHAGRRACGTSRRATTSSRAFVNVYSEFRRADGHVLWMHDDQWEGQRWTRRRATSTATPQTGPHRPGHGRRRQAGRRQGHPAGRGAARHAVGEALQVPEPDAHEVLGTAHLPRRHRPAAARLRQRDDQLPGALRPGPFLARRAARVRSGVQADRAATVQHLRGLDEGRLPAHDRRHVPAPERRTSTTRTP